MRLGRAVSLWGPCLLWMALIYWLSSRPDLPDLGPDIYPHFFEYAVLAALVARAVGGGVEAVTVRHGAWSVALASLYALTDELHQGFVPGRHPSAKDWVVDALGAASVAALLVRRSRVRARRAGATLTSPGRAGEVLE